MKDDEGPDSRVAARHPVRSSLSRGHLLILCCAVMWSFGGLFVKVLRKHYGADPAAIACLRSAAAGLVLAWALPGLATAPKGRALASAVAYTAVVSSFVVAVAGTTAANAIFLQYAYPLFVAVGAVWFFREALGRRTLAALALGAAGVATILVFSWQPGQRQGLVCGFGSSIAFAALALLQRSMRRGSPIALSSFYNLTAAVLLLPLAWGRLSLSAEALLLLALMGILQLGVPYVFFIQGLRSVPATDGALITLAEPILNPIWVWLFFGEPTAGGTMVGGALILLALLVRFLPLRVTAGAGRPPRTKARWRPR